MLAPEEPEATLPNLLAVLPASLERQYVTDRLVQTSLKHAPQPKSLLVILEPVISRIDVDRQLAFACQKVNRVFERGYRISGIDFQSLGQQLHESFGIGERKVVFLVASCDQLRIAPDRMTIFAPVAGQRPARKLLAGIPL